MFFLKRSVLLLSIVMIFCVFGSIRIASGSSSPEDLVNIVLISIDTLRPDHLGCYGYSSIKTPNIDRLAQDGILFTNAYSPVPITLPSHSSIMTGQYPNQHGVQNNGTFVLADPAKTLAEILQEFGYNTGAVVASFVLASHYGLNQGFDYYDDFFYKKVDKIQNDKLSYRDGKAVTDVAGRWLRKSHKKPFFLWVHYFDPHTPYDPPSPYDDLYEGNPYDGEIAFADQCIGNLIEEIKKLSLEDNTCIILIGDHGEGLGEHNERTHCLFIYDTTLKVPLIVSCPRLFPKGNKVTSLVRTIDIMPTILDFLGIKAKEINVEGKSLVPLLTGKEKDMKLNLYCESLYPKLNFNWSPLEGIVTSDGWKYIYAPKPELYDLKKDPQEKRNLFSTKTRKSKSLQDMLLTLKKGLSQRSRSAEESKQIALSPEVRERLRSLGYIGCSVSSNEEGGNQTDHLLPDPKDKVSLFVQIEKARDMDEKGEFDQSIHIYEEVLSQDPENKTALYCLGLGYLNTGQPNKALSKIQKLDELDPKNLECKNALGQICDVLSMPEKAIQAYKDALKLNPKIAFTHNNLGMVYLKINALDLAIKEFQSVCSLSQDPILTSIALGNLGGIYGMQGDLEEAVEKFQESIALNLFNIDAHVSLADTYYNLGDIDKSINEWKAILGLWPDDYMACHRIALLFMDEQKTRQAVIYLKESLRIRPDFMEARVLLDQIIVGVYPTAKKQPPFS